MRRRVSWARARTAPAHIEQVQLIGVARLRYRPHTAMTAAWWGHHVETCREYAERYEGVAEAADLGAKATDAA